MSKDVLDRKQVRELKRLGIDMSKAGAYWYRIMRCENGRDKAVTDWEVSFKPISITDSSFFAVCEKTFTLSDLLDMLPETINEGLKFRIWKDEYYNKLVYNVGYTFEDGLPGEHTYSENLIDACFDLVCWCLVNGHIETNKNK